RIKYVTSDTNATSLMLSTVGILSAIGDIRSVSPYGRTSFPRGYSTPDIAYNIGFLKWVQALAEGSTPKRIPVGNQWVTIPSSRAVGILGVSNTYLVLPSLSERISVLIHEGRHSDCTGGLPLSDLESFRRTSRGLEGLFSIQNTDCGHTHILCP